MNSLSDKPGVLGVIGSVGTAVKQGVTNEIKRTAENTAEQLTGKEQETGEATAGPSAEELKKQSQEAVNWLYPAPPEQTPPPQAVEKKVEVKADLKQQLGLEQKPTNTANPLEQIGLGKDTTTNTISAADQLSVLPKPTLTPEQQQQHAQTSGQLHNEYYQKLTTPQASQSDTEERQKEAVEETETTAQRMDRLHREDEEKKQKEKEEKQPIAVDQAQNAEKNRGSMG